MATRKHITSGVAPLDAQLVATWFQTNGAANPISFAGTVESVIRFTSDGGTLAYRVRTCETDVLSQTGTAVYAVLTGSQHPESDDLVVRTPIAMLNGGVLPAEDHEFDVVIANGGIDTNTLATGRFIYVTFILDETI